MYRREESGCASASEVTAEFTPRKIVLPSNITKMQKVLTEEKEIIKEGLSVDLEGCGPGRCAPKCTASGAIWGWSNRHLVGEAETRAESDAEGEVNQGIMGSEQKEDGWVCRRKPFRNSKRHKEGNLAGSSSFG